MLLWRLQVVPGEVELRPGRSLERTESQELQMCGLRGLEEAWTMTSRLRHFSVKFGRFLCCRRCSRLEAQGYRLKGGGSRSEAGGSRVEDGSSELKAGSSGSEAEGSGLEAGRSGTEAGGSRLEAEGLWLMI